MADLFERFHHKVDTMSTPARCFIALVAFGLFYEAGSMSCTSQKCHLCELVWGSNPNEWLWYKYVWYIVVDVLYFVFLMLLALKMPRNLFDTRPIRLIFKIGLAIFFYAVYGNFKDIRSAYVSFFLALHSIPLCKLLYMPDDSNLLEGLVFLSVVGVSEEYKEGHNKSFGWSLAAVIIGVMYGLKLMAEYTFEFIQLPPPNPQVDAPA